MDISGIFFSNGNCDLQKACKMMSLSVPASENSQNSVVHKNRFRMIMMTRFISTENYSPLKKQPNIFNSHKVAAGPVQNVTFEKGSEQALSPVREPHFGR